MGAALSEMNGHKARTTQHSSCPDRREERFDTDDIHHAREVVGEHVQRHLSRHLQQRFGSSSGTYKCGQSSSDQARYLLVHLAGPT